MAAQHIHLRSVIGLWSVLAIALILTPPSQPERPQRPEQQVLADAAAHVHQHMALYAPYASGPVAAPAQIPMGMPVEAPLSSRFGPRLHPLYGRWRRHAGVDLAAPTGTLVRATAGGWVAKVARTRGYGLYIEIRHGSGYRTRYAHLSRAHVRVGQPVLRGTPIALSGASGRVTGPHLHYEVRTTSGRAVDPLTLTRRRR